MSCVHTKPKTAMVKTVLITGWNEDIPEIGGIGLAKDKPTARWMYKYMSAQSNFTEDSEIPELGFVVDSYDISKQKDDRLLFVLNNWLILN